MTNTSIHTPANDDQRHDWLRLIRSRRVGPSTFYRLLRDYGSAAAALEHLPDVARAAGEKGYAPFSCDETSREIETGRSLGFHLTCRGDVSYPAPLHVLPDPPPVLWYIGNPDLFQRPSISIVGARNASSLGVRMARQIAGELGEAGYVVTSGLARGIDAAAHTGALETGTIAVQAGGLDVYYPKENAQLQDDIAQRGLRLSEQSPGLVPQARHFPQRNRIIAGLSAATVVIEGAARSGSLITARDAADLGRDVMAVPASPLDARAAGCNMLIRDGAVLVRSAQDIIEALQLPDLPLFQTTDTAPYSPEPPPENNAPQIVEKILSLLGPTTTPEDVLIRDTGLPTQAVSVQLLALEMEGRILRHPGGMLALAG